MPHLLYSQQLINWLCYGTYHIPVDHIHATTMQLIGYKRLTDCMEP